MRVRLIGTVMVAAMLVLAACGGDNSNATGKTTTSGSGSGSATTTTGSGGSTGSTDLNDLLHGECGSVGAALSSGIASAFSGGKTDMSQVAAALESFAKDAPDEIKADVKTVADAVQAFAQAVKDSGLDLSNPASFSDPANASKLAGLEAAEAAFQTPAFMTASANVQAYFAAHCSGG